MKTSSQAIYPPIDKAAGVVVYDEKKRAKRDFPDPIPPSKSDRRPAAPPTFSDAAALDRVCEILLRRKIEQAQALASSRSFVKQQAAGLELHYWQICLHQLQRLQKDLPAADQADPIPAAAPRKPNLKGVL